MTHSEMTHWLPSPDGIGFSECPGEMVASEQLRRHLAQHPTAPDILKRSEMWACERCGYTIVTEVDGRGVKRIRNGFPRPTIPELRVISPDAGGVA